MSAKPILTAEGLTKHYGGVPALDGASFTLARGKVTALIGPNGAGKTTLVNCLSGVLRPDAGSVTFDGREIGNLRADRIAALGMARTFQNLRIFTRLSVLDNVLTGLTIQANRSIVKAILRPPSIRNRERLLALKARAALDAVGLSDKADWPAGALAYGDRKRVEMARAFVSDPLLTLLDEPVAGLNDEETAGIAALIRAQRFAGRTMLLIEHDLELVMSVSDTILVLDGGKLIAQGTPEEVRRNPLVLEAYLGRMSVTA
jgi:branched-chain amino acid transport system ATP-binding protein